MGLFNVLRLNVDKSNTYVFITKEHGCRDLLIDSIRQLLLIYICLGFAG